MPDEAAGIAAAEFTAPRFSLVFGAPMGAIATLAIAERSDFFTEFNAGATRNAIISGN